MNLELLNDKIDAASDALQDLSASVQASNLDGVRELFAGQIARAYDTLNDLAIALILAKKELNAQHD